MEKFGRTELTTFLVIGLLILGGWYLWKGQGTTTTQTPQGLVPSDLTTTITLNTKDALATSPTNAEINWYVFKDTGEFYKEGSTSGDGQDSFDVQYGGSYKLIAYNDTSATSGVGFLPEETAFTADTGEGSVKTVNMKLYKLGGLEISSARDPVDLNSQVDGDVAGTTVSIQVLYKVNVSNTAILNPIVRVQGNSSCIDADGVKVSTSGYTAIDCPSRLTNVAAERDWCFKYAGVVKSGDGLRTVDGSIKFKDATACPTGDNVTISMLDEQMYRTPGYVTDGYLTGFLKGAEDTSDTDTGSVDSTTSKIGFAG